MTTKQAQRQSTIDGPKESGNFTLYPATFGLLEWLQTSRKNPLIVGGTPSLDAAMELCFAFTMPAEKVCAMPNASVAAKVKAFKVNLSPQEFFRIQKHAETELMKFSKTQVVPKKKATPRRQKVKR